MNYDNYINKFPWVRKSDDPIGYAQYQQEEARIAEQFYEDFKEELDIVGNPKADKLFSIAWDMGHSSGYENVVSVAWDLVELIK